MPREVQVCEWLSLRDALRAFVQNARGVESGGHIRPLHWYVASRLVVEGGFHPGTIKPRPPFWVKTLGNRHLLHHSPKDAGGGEATVFGGLKTKNIDVVVSLDGIGPCLAISMKGIGGAFRNLTNRLEEAVGDCTNIHIAYPALVYGFLMFVRGNREGPVPLGSRHLLGDGEIRRSDVALGPDGKPVEMIVNYHNAMARLAGRVDLRNDVSRYEAIGMLLVSADDDTLGEKVESYPYSGSPLIFDNFFTELYRQYELRFVLGAPNLKKVTRRYVWDPESPALSDSRALEMNPRLGDSNPEDLDVSSGEA